MSAAPSPQWLAEHPPLLVAPMAGGPSTPELVLAAWQGGFIAQLAGGNKTPQQLEEQIATVEAAGVETFGVNLFVPSTVQVDEDAYAAYRRKLQPEAARLGAQLPAEPVEDDDFWAEKLELLQRRPVPLVSFTFGLPAAAEIAALRARGSLVLQTVTNAAEARAAEAAGVDALVLQSYLAGGHSGAWDLRRAPEPVSLDTLFAEVRAAVGLPIIAARGVSGPARVRELLDAGAEAVSVGTAMLRAPESGASRLHKQALADQAYDGTQLTRAFTGRLARALRNRFVIDHDADAPVGYPAVHNLTRPLRAAAAVAGDVSHLNLWAGVGYRSASDAPVAVTLEGLLP